MKNEKGSLVIESIISFTFFIIILINLIYCIKLTVLKDDISIATKEYLDYAFCVDELFFKSIDSKILYKRYLNNKNINIEVMKYQIVDNYNKKEINIEYCKKIFVFFNLKGKEKLILKKHNNTANKTEMIKTIYNIWNLSNLKRGNEIAKIIGKNQKTNKYDIDIIENKIATSIISMDTNKKTYLTMGNIVNVINKEIKKIKKYKEKNRLSINKLVIVTPKQLTQEVIDMIFEKSKYANIIIKFVVIKEGD